MVANCFPSRPLRAWHVDYGPEFASKGIVTQEPPKVGKPFALLLPQTDRDGGVTVFQSGSTKLDSVQQPGIYLATPPDLLPPQWPARAALDVTSVTSRAADSPSAR